MSRILIVEDEQDLAGLIEYNLHQAGYETEHAPTGAGALARARANPPDLVLLDLMLPDLAGTDVLRMLKADHNTRRTPVVVVSAKGQENDRVQGLELGADDYIVKPFSVRELLLRVKAVMRRGPEENGDTGSLAGGDIQLDIGRHEVLVKGEPVILTALEFRLLRTLLERPERVQTREVLLSDVWGIQAEIHTRTVDTHIKRLREKLGPAGDIIETVRGVGYKLTTPSLGVMGWLRTLLLTLLILLPGVGAAGLVWSRGSAHALGIGALFALVTGGLTFALDRLWRVTAHRHAQAIRALGDARTPLSQARQPAAFAEVLGAVTELDARWQERSASLRQEASTLSATLEGMAEGVWITDRHGGLLRVNRALREMLFSTRPLAGERAMNLFRSAQLEAAVLRACTDGHSSTLELEHAGLRPRLLSVFVTPLGGDLPGSAAVFRDITELRRLEKVRKDFVANVSHELRTPITAIRGYAETLQNGALQDAVMAPRMVEIIHRQSERLSELVEDLLEISHLEGQELQLELEPVDLWTATQRALDTVRVRATTKRIQLQLDVPQGILVQGDNRAVEQVLLNLMDNAVKYSPEGGQVFIRAWEDVDCARVAVRDTGFGMEAKHLARIFERFYRVDKGRSRDMGGTGLGLSIVKHLVGAMQGEVEVASTLNVGTTFTLTLAKADAPLVDAG